MYDNAQDGSKWRRYSAAEEAKVKAATKKRNFLHRLYIDGFIDYRKSTSKSERIFWFVVIFCVYCCALGLMIRLISRYQIGKKVIAVENRMPTDNFRYFPQITVCHTAAWNRTYLDQNVQISDASMKKAEALRAFQLMTAGNSNGDLAPNLKQLRGAILEEFSRYIGFYSVTYDSEFEDENVWTLLTEIFEENFQNVQFSDFISDAALRAKHLFDRCMFAGYRFACKSILITLDMPSCYVVALATPTAPLYPFGTYTRDFDNPYFTFEMSIPTEHIFRNTLNDQSMQNLGVRVTLGTPTPFSEQLFVPPNTHAMITFEHIFISSISTPANHGSDTLTLFSGPYSYDMCMAEQLENKTKQICGCYFPAGDFSPRNDLVCTPKIAKECIKPKMLRGDTETQIQMLKANCHRSAGERMSVSTVTFFQLEQTNESMRNKFTFRQHTDRWMYQRDQDLCDYYQLVCDLGGLASVYTGLSMAAIVHAVTLLSALGLGLLNKKFVKPLLGPLVAKKIPIWATNLTTTNDRKIHKISRRIRTRRMIRVQPSMKLPQRFDN